MDLDTALVTACWANLAVTMVMAGTVVFGVLIVPAPGVRLTRLAGLAALASGAAWLVLQAGELSGDVGGALPAVPVVLAETRFGTLFLWRMGLTVLTVLMARQWPRLAMVPALGAVGLQTLLGHGAADGDRLATGSLLLHLLAAAAWLGGLPALWVALDGARAVDAVRRFSWLGFACVAVIAATALVQAGALAGGLPGLAGTAYGHLLLLKATGFAALIGLAAINRFVFMPRLPAGGVGRLRASVMAESLIGLAVVGAACLLSSQPPGAHQQPMWPFSLRPSLLTLAEPELRQEILAGAAGLAGAGLLLVSALAIRRIRWPILAAGALALWLGLPHLRPLLVEAYPTSYFTSPSGFAAASIVRGAALFGPNCASCHGAEGRGDGPNAAALAIPPADLTAAHLWDHSDGDLFWWLARGMDNPAGGLSMPGFADTLDDDARWALIDYIHAHNAGVTRLAGLPSQPLRAPGFTARCADGRVVTPDDLRGQPILVVVPADEEDIPVLAGTATIALGRGTAKPGMCIDPSPESLAAYAIVSGVPAAGLVGARLIIDPDGWLRTRADSTDPALLAAEIESVCANRLRSPTGVSHAHVH